MKQSYQSTLAVQAQATGKSALDAGLGLSTHYKIEARNAQGQHLWTEEFDNIVVTAGLNDALDKHFKASSYTSAWYVGLLSGTPTVDAGDTMGTHAGWTEIVAYDELVRQTLTLGSISGGSVSNTAAPAVFTISTNSTTVGGAFLSNGSAKATDSGYNTGVLYGAGAFTGGNKTLSDGDSLSITVTLTATAA